MRNSSVDTTKETVNSFDSNNSTSTVSKGLSEHQSQPKRKKLYSTFEDFSEGTLREFIEGSGVHPSFFENGAIEIVSDTRIENGEPSENPIAEFLRWSQSESQAGFALRESFFAALMFNEDGSPWQAKLSFQKWNEGKNRYNKPYLAPKEAGSRAFLPPIPAAVRQAISKRNGVEFPSDGSFWDFVEQHPEIPIPLTEGGKKSLCAISQGYAAIALYGKDCLTLKQQDGSYIVNPELARFCQPGRTFVIALDRDEKPETVRSVGYAIKRACELLEQFSGVTAKVALWQNSEGKGLDDLCIQSGADAVEFAIENAIALPRVPAVEVPQCLKDKFLPHIEGAEPSEYLFLIATELKHVSPSDQSDCIQGILILAAEHLDSNKTDLLLTFITKSTKLGKKSLKKDLETVKANRQRISLDVWLKTQDLLGLHAIEGDGDSKRSVSPIKDGMTFPQMVSASLFQDPWICVARKLYQWTGTYYRYSNDEVELSRIQAFANEFEVDRDERTSYPFANPVAVKNALEWVKMQFAVSYDRCNPSGLNCTNGVLQISYTGKRGNIPEFTLVPHNPDFYYLYEPMVTYDPQAPSEDCDRLMDALDKPQQEVLLEVGSASFDLETVRKHHGRNIKGLLIKGVGSNGKDAHKEAFSLLFGRSGLTSVTLQDFQQYDEGRKFPLAKLVTSRINWASENKKGISIDDLQSLKQAITGEELDHELKGQNEKPFKPKAVFIFNLNDVPNIKAGLQAIQDRFAVISYNKVYATKPNPAKGEMQADPRYKYDRDFMRNHVLSAFLNRVIAAFTDLMQNGIDYSCCDEALEKIQVQNSHLFEFAKDSGLTFDRGSVIPVKDLWRELEQYYIDTDVLTINTDGRRVWADDVRPGDPYIKAANQLPRHIQKLYPQCEKVEIGHRQMGIKGLTFAPPSIETIGTEPTKVEEPDAQPQPDQTSETTEALPTWAKVGGYFLDVSGNLIRIEAIQRTSDGVLLIDRDGDKYKLSECRPEIIPTSLR
ncbi:MAG: DUF3854 domain-containing protein [Phormidium tanganyikae FI6-MK23]|jgi:phage/plasmid-associated DNA primase|nr:DUF3854 domain-containing protein [Phormidium tanganyikae FI6-MK23]